VSYEDMLAADDVTYHEAIRDRLWVAIDQIVSHSGMSGSSNFAKVKMSVMDYLQLQALMETTSAVKHIAQTARQARSVHYVIRCEYQGVENLYRLSDNHPSLIMCGAQVKLMQYLIVLFFIAFPFKKAEQVGWCPDRLDGARHVSTLARDTPPADFANCVRCPRYATDKKSADDRWGFPLSLKWLNAGTPLVDLGREYVYTLGLRESEVNSKDPAAKQLLVVEEMVLVYFRLLLTKLENDLVIRLDSAQAMRNKIYGLFFSALLSLISALWSQHSVQ